MSNKKQGHKVLYTLESYNKKNETIEEIGRFERLDKARKKMREVGHFSELYSRYFDKENNQLYIKKWEKCIIWGNLYFTAVYYI